MLAILACLCEVFGGPLCWSEGMSRGWRILKVAAVVALLAGFGGCAGDLSNSSPAPSAGTASSTMASQPTASFASWPNSADLSDDASDYRITSQDILQVSVF